MHSSEDHCLNTVCAGMQVEGSSSPFAIVMGTSTVSEDGELQGVQDTTHSLDVLGALVGGGTGGASGGVVMAPSMCGAAPASQAANVKQGGSVEWVLPGLLPTHAQHQGQR